MLLVAVFCACQLGCVQRRLTIRSNPPGALVYVDDYPIGTTPVSTDFVYYGQRKMRLVLSGYETLTVIQPIPTPWYQYPGLDFVSENLVPGEIRDERVVEYQLQPQMIVPSPQLLGRAENLRHGAMAPQSQLPQAPGQPPIQQQPYQQPPMQQAPGQPPFPPQGYPQQTYPQPQYSQPQYPQQTYPQSTYPPPGMAPGFAPPKPIPGPPVTPPPTSRPGGLFN